MDKKAVVLIVLSVLAALLSAHQLPKAKAIQVVMQPTADSYVDGYSRESNYGGAIFLYVRNYTYEYLGEASQFAFLTFAVPDLPLDAEIAAVALRLHTGPIGFATNIVGVFICYGAWSEFGITWSNKPITTSTPIDTRQVGIAGTYYEFNLTSAEVLLTLSTQSHISVALKTLHEESESACFYSREDDFYPPELIINYTADTVAPAISLLSPENQAYNQPDIDLTFTVNESTSWMGYSFDGHANETIGGNVTLFDVADGPHTVRVFAEDAVGNTGVSSTISFSVDTVTPQIEILSPENKTYASSSVSLQFSLSEIASWIGYSVDQKANVTTAGSTTMTGLTEGSHQVIAYAKDSAGNIGTSQVVYFTTTPAPNGSFSPEIIAAIVIVAIVGVAVVVYFTKFRKR